MEYVVIKSIPDYPWDMNISYAKHWEQRWSGLDVGHRGLGTSFQTKKYVNIFKVIKKITFFRNYLDELKFIYCNLFIAVLMYVKIQ